MPAPGGLSSRNTAPDVEIISVSCLLVSRLKKTRKHLFIIKFCSPTILLYCTLEKIIHNQITLKHLLFLYWNNTGKEVTDKKRTENIFLWLLLIWKQFLSRQLIPQILGKQRKFLSIFSQIFEFYCIVLIFLFSVYFLFPWILPMIAILA